MQAQYQSSSPLPDCRCHITSCPMPLPCPPPPVARPPALRLGLPSSYVLWKRCHRHIQRDSIQPVLGPAKLRMRFNSHAVQGETCQRPGSLYRLRDTQQCGCANATAPLHNLWPKPFGKSTPREVGFEDSVGLSPARG